MAKPQNYDRMTDSEKLKEYDDLMKSRGSSLVRQALKICGNADRQEMAEQMRENLLLSDNDKPEYEAARHAARLGFMMVALPALEAAIGTLTMKDAADRSNIEDLEIIRDGFEILTRIETEDDGHF